MPDIYSATAATSSSAKEEVLKGESVPGAESKKRANPDAEDGAATEVKKAKTDNES